MSFYLSDFNSISQLDLIANQLVEGFITGLHKSPYHGFSVEFAEYKLYNVGESTRHIDWKVFAKTDRLYTKQYEEETNLRCRILIDNSSSMHYPLSSKEKLKFSMYASSALAYLLTKQRDAVGVTFFSDKIDYESSMGSTSPHLKKLFTKMEELPSLTPTGTTDVVSVIHEIAEKSRRRSLIIIFSDMFQNSSEDDVISALQHLKHNNHEVILFHVIDHHTEISFDFSNRTHQFTDMETQEKIKVNPVQVKEIYQQSFEKFYHTLKIKCGMMKIDFVEVDTSTSFDKILRAYLIKRAKMK